MIQRPRGTRDFKPEDMLTRRRIETALRSKAEHFGYSEVSTPTFELAELFLRKSGPGILNQIYMFKDKGDRELMLRPELTAPVIRFYANELYKFPKPLKVFYVGNCFRYERPQKGRFREFWQFGAELIGTNKPEGIAELIAFARACIIQAELKNFEIRIGHIQILKKILTSWNISSDLQGNLMTLIDKGDIDTLQNMLQDTGLDNQEVSAFSELVCGKFPINEFDERQNQLISSFPAIVEELDRLKSVLEFLKTFGVVDVNIDLGIARGIDYYTGVVFEIDVPSLGAEKQVCGGGEYSLDELFNLNDVYCSGFAIGFDRLVIATELEGLKPNKPELDIYFIPLTKPGITKAIELSTQLREAGFKVEFDIKGRNMSKNLKFASTRNTKFAVFIGDDELKNNSATVRAMATGEQSDVKFKDLNNYFKNLIAS